MKSRYSTILMVAAWLGMASSSLAQTPESKFDLGFRFNILTGNGKPTNDILGVGVNARFRLNDRWWVGVGIDQSDEFDVEGPAGFFSLPAVSAEGVIDAKGTSTMLLGWIERVYDRGGRSEWFWTAGAGFNFVDVDPVSGPLADGGDFRIVTDAGDEMILSISAGLRRRLGPRWAFEIALRGDQHFADWTLLDEVSGASTVVDDYFVSGLTVGLRYRF